MKAHVNIRCSITPSPGRRYALSGVLCCCLLLTAAETAVAQSEPADPGPLTQQIDQIVASAFQQDQPGVALLVVKDGQSVYKGARGMADMELGVSLEPDMVFRLGSITKQFTAAAIMLLKEEGKLALDDEITKFLPDYPTQGATITVEHLLNHTSGIRSYTDIPGWMETQIMSDLSVEALIDGFKNEPMDFQPGTEFRYNNSGYVLLGAVIEKASGLSYAEFIQQRIFSPLQMEHSWYGDHSTIIKNRVEGYDGSPASPINAKYLSMTQPYAAGSLLANVEDLGKWNQALFAGQVVHADSLDLMIRKGRLNDGAEFDYGFGLVPGDIRGHRSIAHGGGIFGFSTYAVYLPEDDVFVAAFCNSSQLNPAPTATRIAALVAGDPFPEFKKVALGEEILERYAGVYKIDETNRRYISVDQGRLLTRRSAGSQLEALPHSETGFFYESTPSHFEFVLDDQGNVTGMNMFQGGSKTAEFAEKVDEAMPAVREVAEIDFALYDDYLGEYELVPGFTLTITRDGNQLLAQGTGQPALEIFPASETVFFSKAVEAEMTFVRGDDGQVNELRLKQGGQELSAKRK